MKKVPNERKTGEGTAQVVDNGYRTWPKNSSLEKKKKKTRTKRQEGKEDGVRVCYTCVLKGYRGSRTNPSKKKRKGKRKRDETEEASLTRLTRRESYFIIFALF